jgi:hypothetical protein
MEAEVSDRRLIKKKAFPDILLEAQKSQTQHLCLISGIRCSHVTARLLNMSYPRFFIVIIFIFSGCVESVRFVHALVISYHQKHLKNESNTMQ